MKKYQALLNLYTTQNVKYETKYSHSKLHIYFSINVIKINTFKKYN